jgi:hypothetical protein
VTVAINALERESLIRLEGHEIVFVDIAALRVIAEA